jgi:hypothetical protein
VLLLVEQQGLLLVLMTLLLLELLLLELLLPVLLLPVLLLQVLLNLHKLQRKRQTPSIKRTSVLSV